MPGKYSGFRRLKSALQKGVTAFVPFARRIRGPIVKTVQVLDQDCGKSLGPAIGQVLKERPVFVLAQPAAAVLPLHSVSAKSNIGVPSAYSK